MHRVHFRIGRTSDQFQRNGRNSTQVNGIEGAVISYMDINGQTAVVIETEHPENEADYYVGIAWDNGEKSGSAWIPVGYPRRNDQNRPQRQKNTQKLKKVCPVRPPQLSYIVRSN